MNDLQILRSYVAGTIRRARKEKRDGSLKLGSTTFKNIALGAIHALTCHTQYIEQGFRLSARIADRRY